jgi:hypothetical protein
MNPPLMTTFMESVVGARASRKGLALVYRVRPPGQVVNLPASGAATSSGIGRIWLHFPTIPAAVSAAKKAKSVVW